MLQFESNIGHIWDFICGLFFVLYLLFLGKSIIEVFVAAVILLDFNFTFLKCSITSQKHNRFFFFLISSDVIYNEVHDRVVN